MNHLFGWLGLMLLICTFIKWPLVLFELKAIAAQLKFRWESVIGVTALRVALAKWQSASELHSMESRQRAFLLANAAMRSVPRDMTEILGGSNSQTGNACYIHPAALARVQNSPFRTYSDPFTQIVRSGSSVIAITTLMPECGVIFAPLNPLFLGAIAGRLIDV